MEKREILQSVQESKPGACEAYQVQREIPYWENPAPQKNKGRRFFQSVIVNSSKLK